MTQYVNKTVLVAEIEKRLRELSQLEKASYEIGLYDAYKIVLSFLDALEVKEVDEQKERMSECPYRQVVCTMYEGKILECNGACSWVVDYPKLKELKARKGE